MQTSLPVGNIESERLLEEFESLARSVKCSQDAHTFSAARGVTVVWNAPLNCFRNSIATKAVVTHNPSRLPTSGRRFLEHVERLTCQEQVFQKKLNTKAFTQHWKFSRKGHLEFYSLTRVYRNDAKDVTEIVIDRNNKTREAKRNRFGF